MHVCMLMFTFFSCIYYCKDLVVISKVHIDLHID